MTHAVLSERIFDASELTAHSSQKVVRPMLTVRAE